MNLDFREPRSLSYAPKLFALKKKIYLLILERKREIARDSKSKEEREKQTPLEPGA